MSMTPEQQKTWDQICQNMAEPSWSTAIYGDTIGQLEQLIVELQLDVLNECKRIAKRVNDDAGNSPSVTGVMLDVMDQVVKAAIYDQGLVEP